MTKEKYEYPFDKEPCVSCESRWIDVMDGGVYYCSKYKYDVEKCVKYINRKQAESDFSKGDVVQFNDNHKWCGCLGIINEVKNCTDDVRYMVGIPIPMQGTAYIFSMKSKNEIEKIGEAIFMEESE